MPKIWIPASARMTLQTVAGLVREAAKRLLRLSVLLTALAVGCGSQSSLSRVQNDGAADQTVDHAVRLAQQAGTSEPEGGITGTGVRGGDDEGGIGGTGVLTRGPDEGGIGGTGIEVAGDTGIIGTVTDFGSIWVTGIEIHYDADTPVRIDTRAGTTEDLAIGQVVEVVADSSGAEVKAQAITVRHVVSGPISELDPTGDQMFVLGQTVAVSDATRSDDAEDLQEGTFVDISGLRRGDGVIVASRVKRVPSRETVHLTGPVAMVAADALQVAGTVIQIEGDQEIDESALGREAYVSGNWDGASILAHEIRFASHLPFGGRVERVEMEGYISGQLDAGQLRVGTWRIDVPEDAAATDLAVSNIQADQRVQVTARVRAGRIVAERLAPARDFPAMPPRPGTRRERQRELGAPGGAGPDANEPEPFGPQRFRPRPGAPGAGDAAGEDGVDGGSELPAGPEMQDRPGQPQRPDVDGPRQRPERPDRPQRSSRPEHPARPDVPERPDLPERPDVPERVDLPERPDVPERPQRPHRPERPGFRGRP